MEETRRCPYCGEEILAVAKKCKHCGEWLEAKKPAKKKKPCPVCGEQIDVDVSICPYCNEPTYYAEKRGVSDMGPYNAAINNGSYLYCKTCKSKISSSAGTCPKCGDDDPFYFKDIKKVRKNTDIGCVSILCIAFVLTFIFQYLGSKNGIMTWSRTEGRVFLVVLALFIGIGKVSYYFCKKEHKEEMNRIFQSKHDDKAQEIWENKLNEKE